MILCSTIARPGPSINLAVLGHQSIVGYCHGAWARSQATTRMHIEMLTDLCPVGLRWTYLFRCMSTAMQFMSLSCLLVTSLPVCWKRLPSCCLVAMTAHTRFENCWAVFWSCYEKWHPSHTVFEEAREGDLDINFTLPVLIHGDEGRGVRKGNIAVCSVETPFGLDTHTESRCHAGPCCDKNNLEPSPADFQTTNLKFHSFLTKLLLFLMPNKLYKQQGVLTGWLRLIFTQMRSLFYEGVQVGRRTWHIAVVGLKGDMAWFQKIADLDRHYNRLSKTFDQMCCHECLAGCSEMPFEDLSDNPSWASSVFTQRPWLAQPASGLCLVPFDAARPEAILRRDIFHNLKVGALQDFIAGAIVVIAEFGYFCEGSSHLHNAFATVFQRMFGHFKLYCITVAKISQSAGLYKAISQPAHPKTLWLG